MDDKQGENRSIKYQFFVIMIGFVLVALAFYILKEIQVYFLKNLFEFAYYTIYIRKNVQKCVEQQNGQPWINVHPVLGRFYRKNTLQDQVDHHLLDCHVNTLYGPGQGC